MHVRCPACMLTESKVVAKGLADLDAVADASVRDVVGLHCAQAAHPMQPFRALLHKSAMHAAGHAPACKPRPPIWAALSGQCFHVPLTSYNVQRGRRMGMPCPA
jgi:hypothetical protein